MYIPCISLTETRWYLRDPRHPAKEVGGDFCDFFGFWLDLLRIWWLLWLSSVKGVPAALFMVIGKTPDHGSYTAGQRPGEVFAEVNNILCESNENGNVHYSLWRVCWNSVTRWIQVCKRRTWNAVCLSQGNQHLRSLQKAGFCLAGIETSYI